MVRVRGPATVVGAICIAAVGLLITGGHLQAVLVTVALGVMLVGASRVVSDSDSRDRFALLVLLAFALRVIVATLLHDWSVQAGRGGFITGDDRLYAQLAWSWAENARSQPEYLWAAPPGDPSLARTWVALEAALFLVFGRDLLVALAVNAAIGAALVPLIFDMARRLFGARAAIGAALLVSFWPSLVLWSALNLKDALSWLLSAIVLSSLLRFQATPRWSSLLVATAAAFLTSGTRPYLFMALAGLIAVAAWIAPDQRTWVRLRWGSIATVMGTTLLLSGSGLLVGTTALQATETTRSAMAIGARTAFVERPNAVAPRVAEPNVNRGTQGATEAISASPRPASQAAAPLSVVTSQASSSLASTGQAADSPRTTSATVTSAASAPNAGVLTPGSRSPASASSPNFTVGERASSAAVAVIARPTQLAEPYPPAASTAVAATAATVAPGRESQSWAHQAGPVRPQIQPGSGPEQSVLLRSLAYLPRGLAFALFAPFPWHVERALDLPAVVETLLFDVVMVAAVATLWRARSRWRSIVAPALLIAWLTLIFALAQGNFGTLFRHRGMLIPWVILLGAPVLVEVMDAACRWTQRGTALGRYSRWPRWQRLLS